VRGAIHQDWRRFTGWYRRVDWCRWYRLSFTCRSEFGGPHGSGRKALSEFQAKIPDPLAQDLPELLPTRGMRTPAIGILLLIFIGQHRLKRSPMEIQV